MKSIAVDVTGGLGGSPASVASLEQPAATDVSNALCYPLNCPKVRVPTIYSNPKDFFVMDIDKTFFFNR